MPKLAFYLILMYSLVACNQRRVNENEDPCFRMTTFKNGTIDYSLEIAGNLNPKITMDDQGNLVGIVQGSIGTEKSVVTTFYPSGTVKAVGAKRDGLAEGELFFYWESGVLSEYSCYVNDSLAYSLRYDEQGQVESFPDGYAFLDWSFDGFKVKKDFSGQVVFYIAKPPVLESYLLVDYLDKDGFSSKRDTIRSSTYKYVFDMSVPSDDVKTIKLTSIVSGFPGSLSKVPTTGTLRIAPSISLDVVE